MKYDAIIVGAGPSGASCAIKLAQAGLKIALLDKERFPRDKICGDALSVDVLNQLPLLSLRLSENFKIFPHKTSSPGVRIISPGNVHVDIPFVNRGVERSGYICSRSDFDNLLVDEVKCYESIDLFEECSVKDITITDEVSLTTSTGSFRASFVIGADGAHSIVRRLLLPSALDRKHHSAGLRVYYEGVEEMHAMNYIELYFFKEILPGYLWIFPSVEGRCNVGLGMLSSVVSKKKFNLPKVLNHLTSSHPTLKQRFLRAHPLENVKGHGLPLGGKKRVISGERHLLIGDAAGLIDPFSGEGIGNAIRSGRVAAEHVQKCFRRNIFSASFNLQYDAEIYHKMGAEFNISRSIQRLCNYPWLFDMIMKKAARSIYWKDFLTKSLADVQHKKAFVSPSFYYKMLFE